MHKPNRSNSSSAHVISASALGVLCGLIVAAPFLASHACSRAAAVIYFLFSPICHQMPDRSFTLFGSSLAVCHRCAGIYLGLFLGSFLKNRAMHRSANVRRFWIFGAIVPILFDIVAPFAGFWTNTAFTRFSTGLLFGTLISSLLVRGVSEFVQEAPWRRLTLQNSQLKGGLS